MADDMLNVAFVREIQKYPCIYNTQRSDHSKREVVDRAWATIAKDLNYSVSDCKDKWKNLRTAFARTLKKPVSGVGKRNRTYYLKDVMQFVMPYMKARDFNSNNSLPVITDDIIDNISCNSFNSDDVLDSASHLSKGEDPLSDSDNTSSKRPLLRRCAETEPTTQEVNTCFIEYEVASKEIQTDQPRTLEAEYDFMKSLLPDLEKMTAYQRRLFKRRMLEAIDEILSDGPSTSQ